MNPSNSSWTGNAPQPGQVPTGAPNGRGALTSRVNAGPNLNGNGTERPVTFWSILDAFRRRWIPAVAVAIPAALLVAGILWQMIPAQFETSALLKVSQFQQKVVGSSEERSEFINYRNTQINYIQSRPILTAAMRVDGIKESRLMKDIKYPVEYLESELEVKSDYSEEFIRISLEGEYPEDIAAVVNAVKDVYLDEVFYNERNDRIQQLRTMEEKFSELDQTVEKNLDRIDRLAKELGTTDSKTAGTLQQLITTKISQLSRDLQEINADLRQEETLRQFMLERGYSPEQIRNQLPGVGLNALRSGQASGLPLTSANDDRSDDARKKLASLRSNIQEFERNIRNEKHPDLLRMKAQEKQLAEAVQGFGAATPDVPGRPSLAMSNYELLLKKKEKLLAEIKAEEENFSLNGERIIEMERETGKIAQFVNARKKLADEIENRKIELDASPRITVVQEANVPEKRNIKKRVQMATVGGLGTLMMVLAGFTMFEWFSHRVGSTSDIANAVNLRLVGTIPSPDKGGLLGLGIFAGKVDYDEWNRAVIESMDVVRTYLMRHIDPSRSASILITSASANEGKTTVSCQLAASLARSGKRVAIVDCDFRRPSAHLMMDGREGPGISEYLRGEVSLPDICQDTQASGLTFIPAGQVDQEVLQKLTVDGGRGIIDTLKAQFDFVIIDTSPLLFVAEPSMLAQNADIVLLSTRKDYSRIPYVAQSRDSLRSLQVPLLGAVMVGSDSDFQRSSYGYRQEVQKHVRREQPVNS